MKKNFRKVLKIFLWILGSIVFVFLLLVILLQVPAVQNFVKEKAVSYLEEKIQTKVSIDKIEIGLPKNVIVEGIYLQDQQKDTLLYGEKVLVNISLFKLIRSKVEIENIELTGIVSNINRNEKGEFNFDYIINAFATEEPKEESKSTEILLDKIDLNNIQFSFKDALTKNDFNLTLGHFDTRVKSFDLENLDFEVPKIVVENLNLKLKQGVGQVLQNTKEVAEDAKKEPNLKLRIGEVDLRKIDIRFENESNYLETGLAFEKLLIKFNEIDLKKQFIDIASFDLKQTKANLVFGKIEEQVTKESVTENTPNNWKLKLDKILIEKLDFQFDDEKSIPIAKGIDYRHLHLQNLNLDASKLSYATEDMAATIHSFQVNDKSGLEIQSFSTDFKMTPTGISLEKLFIKTPQTEIKNKLVLGFTSLESMAENPSEIAIGAKLLQTKIAFQDLLLFAPQLAQDNPFKSHPNAILLLNTELSGKVGNLQIPFFQISGIGQTNASLSGSIIGLPDIEKTYFDLSIDQFQSTSNDVLTFVPSNTIPTNIQLPSTFNLNGNFKGLINDFETNLNLKSSFGDAKVVALFDQSQKGNEKYDAQIDLTEFDLGKLIKNDSIGKLTLKADVKGVGLEPKIASADANLEVIKATFNSYTYQNVSLKGAIQNGDFEITTASQDPNITFDGIASGSFKTEYPTGKLTLNLEMVDLQKLNFMDKPFRFKGIVEADMASTDIDFLNGDVVLHEFVLANEKEQFTLDSIKISATSTAENNSIQVESQFLDAAILGKYKLSKIGTSLSNSIQKYYNSPETVTVNNTEEQHFAFNVAVKNTPILQKIIPDLTGLEPISIDGRYNTVNDSIVMKGKIPLIKYGKITITNAVIDLNTLENALVYSVIVDDIQNEQFQIPHTSLTGKAENNVIEYALQLQDDKGKERYFVAGTLEAKNGLNEVSLDSEKLVLNYNEWQMAADNLIRFGQQGINASNFDLSKGENKLTIQSETSNLNAPIAIDFDNFEIETLTSFAQRSQLEMTGKINGNANIRNINSTPIFTSDLTVENFTFKKDTVGDVKLKVNNETAATFNAEVSITSQDNKVDLNGFYRTSDSSFDMKLAIDKLNLKSIQGFTMGNLTNGKGFFTGNFDISGTVDKPKVIGTLDFNEIGFKVTSLNSSFKSITDQIKFTGESIVFDNFEIKDEKDNDLNINGSILTSTYRDFRFDLAVIADNFKAINSTAKDSDLYYGELYVDTRLNIRGDMNSPVVNGTLRVNEDTKFTVVLPQSDPSIADREGIVEFIDPNTVKLFDDSLALRDSLNTSSIRGILASVNIEIDKEAEFSIIIDKANGDFLKLKGEAQLSGGIDPSGKTTLTGRYEFTEGSYEMSFNLIRRKFDIKSGSYILWTGEPTSANINITAIYKTETSPLDLVSDQLGAVTADVRNRYMQRIPFETELIMTGDLMKPDIAFNIVLPEGNNNVSTDIINMTQTRLAQLRQQPDEMNKQVFALLLLNRFVGENPFALSGGPTASSLARESASKILSQQLNNLAGDIIKGFELEFDLDSSDDFTTGQRETRTDLNVALSKKLLDDRLKITVGSSFGLEGPQQENQDASNIAGDISAEYQLSKDGRYRVRAYRRNLYQVALLGEVVETGVAFIVTIDYNKFKEIFSKKKEEHSKK
ncbi:translocation/assembly module TamB domain-containing protein [Flavobacterium orientale]|uniref:translocation/assembly module TamB domain-containing protein n=1 Tax=Flavobacterium orientale TaxID=1756020 RepID=UPI0016655425|nr:translocation/assembly module TamB domain-containing protein [Flavobacterium orientale]